MVDRLKIAGNGLWLIATLCLYLLTYSAFSNIHAQEDKRLTNSKSPPNKALPSFPRGEAYSKTMGLSNNSSSDVLGASNSSFLLKYNNLGNNQNKAGSTSYNYSGYSAPASAYMQPFSSAPTYPYYNPSYNRYPSSLGAYHSPQLIPPSYYSYPQTSTPFSSSLNSASPMYPLAPPPLSWLSVQPYHYLPSSPPPPPVFPTPRYYPEVMQGSSLGSDDLESEDPVERDESKMVSPWFPSVPASDCEGIFEFTVEGTANLLAKNLKSGNHKITIKMTSDSPGSINGQLWVDKKTGSDKGSKFNIDKTFNNCRVVTASSSPTSTGEQDSPTSLLNSLLNDLPDNDYSAQEQSTIEADSTVNSQQQEEGAENSDDIKRKGKSEIASLDLETKVIDGR